MPAKLNIIGQRFKMLVVLKELYTNKHKKLVVLCECDCGNQKEIVAESLRNGDTKSCGCLKTNKPHHKILNHQEYRTWAGMLTRCRNSKDSNFRHYGGRGITVCERWLNFENFLFDMGKKPSKQHSIDRINNNGNYEPLNCRWATKRMQDRNRRNNRIIEYKGQSKPFVEWAEVLKTTQVNLYDYLLRHTFEEAVEWYTNKDPFAKQRNQYSK